MKNTQQITKAMKMVASQAAARPGCGSGFRPYATLSADRERYRPTPDVEPQVEDVVANAVAGVSSASAISGNQARLIQRSSSGRMGRASAWLWSAPIAVWPAPMASGLFRRCERFFVEQRGLTEPAVRSISSCSARGTRHFRRRRQDRARLTGVEPVDRNERAGSLARCSPTSLLRAEVDAIYVCYNEFRIGQSSGCASYILPLSAAPDGWSWG